MILELNTLEDRIVERLQAAVVAGELGWAGSIGDDTEAAQTPKLPGVAVLLRRGTFNSSESVGLTRQQGRIEWTLFVSGSNLRERGKRAGRRGDTGAYRGLRTVIKYLDGFLMTADASVDSGFPIQIDSFDLASLDQSAQRAMYELNVWHEFEIVEDGFE